MLELVSNFIKTKHKHVLFIITSLTLFFSLFLPSVQFKTNIEEFYPENDAVKADERIEDYFGKDPYLQYLYITPKKSYYPNSNASVLSLKALQEEYNITQRLRKIEGVVGTISVAEYLSPFLEINNFSSFIDADWSVLRDLIINAENDNSAEYFFFMQQMLISNNSDFFTTGTPLSDATIIIIQLNSSLSNEKRKTLANHISEVVEGMELESVETTETGADIMAYQVDKVSNETMKYMGAGIVIIITLILYLSFRRGSYVFLPLLTLVIAIIWTLGTMVLLGLEFSALMVAVLPLMIGLGIDDAVHVSKRYQEELRKGKIPPVAMAITMKSIGVAILLTSVTTIIAFLSNGISGVPPVKEFGFVCAIGISYAFIVTVTFYVGMRYWVDRRGGKKIMLGIKKEAPTMDRFMSKMALTIDSHPRWVVIFVIIVTLLSIYGADQVKTEFSVNEFLPEDLSSMQTTNNIEENFVGGSYTTAYIMYEGGDLDTVHSLDVIYRTTENIRNDEYLVSVNVFISEGSGFLEPSDQITTPLTVIGMAIDDNQTLASRFNFTEVETNQLRNMWLPNNQDTSDRDVKGIYDYLYDNNTEIDPITGETYGSQMRSVLHRDAKGNYNAMLIRLYVNAKSSDESRTVYNELKHDVIPIHGSDHYITGTVVLLIQTVDSIQTSQIQSTTIAVLLAAAILCLIYRNIELGVISIIPVALNITWILGTMALLSYVHDNLWEFIPKMSLNVLTVTVTSLSIGLGIDYSIHVVQRFRENLFQEHDTIQKAIHSTLEHTGSALFISAVTTVAGFGVLIFAPMPLMQMYGIITAASIVFSLLSTTIFLPILLVAWAKHHGHFKIKKKPVKVIIKGE